MKDRVRNEQNARRRLLLASGTLAATPLLSGIAGQASAQPTTTAKRAEAAPIGQRKLGALTVSSLGIGVQNMSRTYQTTIPNRAEMINIIRTAFSRGVTFFDAAEAYGPHEVERILGEAVARCRCSAGAPPSTSSACAPTRGAGNRRIRTVMK